MAAAAAKRQLFAAAEEGDLAKLQSALAAGAPVDVRDGEGRVALHLAAMGGHAAVIRALLASGSNPSLRRHEDDRTALHLAAEEGHVDVVSELLAGGAEVSAEDFDGSTPLHCAAHYGNVQVVQALLDAGAKVSIRTSSGQTPLLVAGEACGCRWMGREEGPGGYDYVDVVRRLLAAEAAAGGDAAAQSAGAGVPGVGCEVDSTGEGAVHAAVRAGNVQVVAALCDARAGVAVSGPRGITPLHLAAAAGQVECVRLLVGAGAPLEAREKEGGLTPLHVAVQSRQLEVVEALIAEGADRTSPDNSGLTPLHTAAQLGPAGAPLLRALLANTQPAAGAPLLPAAVNTAGNVQRVTPLHLAVATATAEGAAGPTARGVGPYISEIGGGDSCGSRADVVVVGGDNGSGSGSGERGSDSRISGTGTPPVEAAEVAEAEAVRVLLRGGADIRAVDASGNTPLHVAAARGNVAAVRALLDALGTSADGVSNLRIATARLPNSSGFTPWQLAHAAGHLAVLKLLPQ
ncbi:hypothetical protein VaNZ11_016034 [Volvox africanus]|uniref:Uncharacterized protein n=1 Tax=Volvox africanus TaxID=51714 RepID=A0ABQ5SNG2_9CHLO|nr:hypothetical protein VaNZ11_016034 [Volvox africanus]